MPHNVMSTEKNIQNILELMRRDDSVDAPADSVRWASNLFRTRAAEAKPSLVKKLVAVFQTEIAPNRPAFGERSATLSAVRQILYRAADIAVDIRIEKANKGFTVRGQVLGNSFAGAAVRLWDDTRSFEVSASKTSEFRFDDIPTGQYELAIRSSEVEVTLKSIDVS